MNKIYYNREAGRWGCCAVLNESGEYEMFGKMDTYIGHVKKCDDGYYGFISENKYSRDMEQDFISYVLNSLNNVLRIPDNHYVYMVFVDKELRYIGKGVDRRFSHAVSGISHKYQLNRDYFQDSLIEVFSYREGMDSNTALMLENELISTYVRHHDLYNSKFGNFEDYEVFRMRVPDSSELYSDLYNQSKLIGVKVGKNDEYEFFAGYDKNLQRFNDRLNQRFH